MKVDDDRSDCPRCKGGKCESKSGVGGVRFIMPGCKYPPKCKPIIENWGTPKQIIETLERINKRLNKEQDEKV